jgi:autotransporter-associated beta strand protein
MRIMQFLWSPRLRNELRKVISFRLCPPVYLVSTAILILLLAARTTGFGDSATWNLNPGSGLWNTATNWTPVTVPNGPNDIATFGVSNTTSIENDTLHDIEVNAIVFSAGASAFTITFGNSSFFEDYRISGAGITNNSGITQNFEIGDFGDSATLLFTNSATAGDQTVFTAGPNCCGTSSYMFQDTSTAGNATLVAHSDGAILFTGDSTGGTARVGLFDGTLDISAHNAPGVTVGSLEGTGTVNLGANNLTVDSNYQGEVFSGIIQDNGTGGSLTKLGSHRLVLANANTYTGGTMIGRGDLFVSNRRGSATGSGSVNVVAGGLGGDGIIAGPVTIGGSRSRAVLLPGDRGVLGTLTFLNTLTFQPHGEYLFDVNSDDALADQVIANGVTIRSQSTPNFIITDVGHGVLKDAEVYGTGSTTWSTTGSMGTARFAHTATLLLSGNVLVAGGGSGLTYSYAGLASGELYDPAIGSWTATGSLTTARVYHTATLLPNGKVLVAGGSNFSTLASAELYDPTNGTWTATGNMHSARFFHTATLLSNGKVLVVGGAGVSSAELYNPATGNWTLTGRPTTSGRALFTATLLPNGKVLVAGGQNGGPILTSAELYDPDTGTWTATGNLATARTAHAATLLSNGTVLVTGGFNFDENLSSAELYDPDSGTWSGTQDMASARYYHTTTLMPNGQVLAAGGSGTDFTEPSAELYDSVSESWTTTGSLDFGRFYHTASLLPDGNVLVAGGVGYALPIGTVFTVINNTSSMPINGTFSNLPDGSMISIGGKNCQVSYEGGDGNDLTFTVVP